MLEQALIALASSGGTAVVTAAGTDAWTGFRDTLAGWFGRGDAEREQAESQRLERTAAELRGADAATAERVRSRQEGVWAERFETLLEALDPAERATAAAGLRALLERSAPARAGVSAGDGGLAVGGDSVIRAEGGGSATGVINVSVTGNPSVPGANQD